MLGLPELAERFTNRGMITITPSPIVLHADQEHSGLRMVIIIALFAGVIFFFLLLNTFWPQIAPPQLVDFTSIIACFGSLVLALVAVWGIEQGLKRVWHSGRLLTLDGEGILVQDIDLPPYTLNWSGNMNQLYWRFTLKGYKRGGRERRVPEKWICLAVQVREGENQLITYTYIAPKQADQLMARHGRAHFHEIHPADVYATDARSRYLSLPSRPEKIPADILAGKDGKQWLAEQRRWLEGFELSPRDFETFISTIIGQQAVTDN
ncbi:MAG: hypothetical protein KJ069_07645 [Anaerolineae bacterium]|nr:hypothetical protein [Anaerolineae bacterium]